MQDIEHAQSYITLEFYIFNDDILGQSMTHSLIRASRRGVTVQIIVDGIGSYFFFHRLYALLTQEKIKIKIYNPLPFLHPYAKKMNYKQKLHALVMRVVRLNKRDHRKIITIDEQIMYCGSFNITAEHTNLLPGLAWKDSGLRVTGSQVKYAIAHFKKNWRLRDYLNYKMLHQKNFPPWKESFVRLNSNLLMRRYFQKEFNKKLRTSKKKAWLMTPYFIPQRSFIKSLAKAARRGVDVRLVLSSKSDVELFENLQTFYFPFLIKSGVKIYQYSSTVLHAKTYLFDDWMTVGSSNLNHRSLIHDLEVDLIVQESENRMKLEEDFLLTMSSSILIDENFFKGRSLFDNLLTQLFFIFRYWL